MRMHVHSCACMCMRVHACAHAYREERACGALMDPGPGHFVSRRSLQDASYAIGRKMDSERGETMATEVAALHERINALVNERNSVEMPTKPPTDAASKWLQASFGLKVIGR